jgi:hypothetical protein
MLLAYIVEKGRAIKNSLISGVRPSYWMASTFDAGPNTDPMRVAGMTGWWHCLKVMVEKPHPILLRYLPCMKTVKDPQGISPFSWGEKGKECRGTP